MVIRKQQPWHTYVLLAMLALSLQSCLGIGNNTFQSKVKAKNGQVGINTTVKAKFQGTIYLTLDRNLYALDGKGNLTQLTKNMDIRDPAVSPNSKWIAFIVRYQNYSDLAYMSTNTSNHTIHIVVTGKGEYYPNEEGANDYFWFAQPAWSSDSSHLLFLSDLQKNYYWSSQGDPFADAYFLDLQVFSLPINAAELTGTQAQNDATSVAYANFGDGGDRDPSYRPGHAEEIVYTHYSYDSTQTQQVVQILAEDANLLSQAHTPAYHPGVQVGSNYDPAVALTPATSNLANLEPSFSPDGNTLLYIRRLDADHMGLYSMSIANNITDDPKNANFDPNSTANQQKALAAYNKSTQLLKKEYLSYPIWSPDGKQIAYYDYNNGTFDLWLATVVKNAKTGTYSLIPNSTVQLTNANGDLDADSHPVWVA